MKEGIPVSILRCSESESDVMKGFSKCAAEGYAGNWAPLGVCPLWLDGSDECTCDDEMVELFKTLTED